MLKEQDKFVRSIIAFQKLTIVLDLSEDAAETDVRPSRMASVLQVARNLAKEYFSQCFFSHISLLIINDSRSLVLSKFITTYQEFDSIVGSLNYTPSGSCLLIETLEKLASNSFCDSSVGANVCIILASVRITGYTYEFYNRITTSNVRFSCLSLVGDVEVIKRLCRHSNGLFVNYNTTDCRFSGITLLQLHRSPKDDRSISKIRSGYAVASFQHQLCSCHGVMQPDPIFKCPRCLCLICSKNAFCIVCSCFVVSDNNLTSFRQSMDNHFLIARSDSRTLCNVCNSDGGSIRCTLCSLFYCQSCFELVSELLNHCIRCEDKMEAHIGGSLL